MNYEKIKNWVGELTKSKWGKAAIVAFAIAAVCAAFGLTSCGQMYAINKAIRYEYELNRQSQTETKTHLKISNETEN